MDALGVVIGLLLLFGVAMVTFVVVAAVKAARAVAATVERQEVKARRAVENVTLKAKTYTRPGSQGQISATRLSLRTSLDGTRLVLESGLRQDGQLAEALQLLKRLDAHAAELDGELRMLEREPDAGRIAVKLPELRERAERITHSAESMRWAAQDRLRRFADDELTRLGEDCLNEAGALRHWDPADGSPAGRSSVDGSPSGGSSVDGSPAGRPASAERVQVRKGVTTGRQPGAEEALGLAEPLTRIAERLRKPSAGPAAGSSSAG